MKFFKKGQEAMEFLLTYGWAILAILLVISALAYLGIFNPRALIPDSCKATGQILCQEASASTGTGSDLVLKLTNNAGSKIKVIKSKFVPSGNSDVSETDCDIAASESEEVSAGATFTIECPGEGNEGDIYSGDVQVSYESTSGLARTVAVKVFQKIGPTAE